MNKKIVAVLLCISMALVSACGIGFGKDEEEQEIKRAIEWEDYSIEIEGSKKTKDNPWGYTAGKIEDSDIGNCILLMPNTSLKIKEIEKYEVVSFQAELHPWVAESSDGAGIDICVMNSNGDILKEDSIEIAKEDSWVDIQYVLSDIEGASQIIFSCNNGEKNDDICDWVIIKVANKYLSNFGNDEYVRSITYFGGEWPINFWNSELETLDEDFQRIVDDGFNSIILVIPWKEFQISVNPIQYSKYPFDSLDKIMKKAQTFNLDVYARIGYSWDYYNDSNECITERFLDIMRTEDVLLAWLDYCKKMYEKLSSYPNFRDSFLTWEDFWGCLAICDNEDEQVRLDYAQTIGYQKWLGNNYDLDSYNEEFGCKYNSIDQIPIPKKSEPAMKSMYQFYDEYLNNLLAMTQEVFPNISLEVRMDADLVSNLDGENEYYSHEKTYQCENSDYTATMYGIPMGFENKGERVSAEDALNHTEYILGRLFNQNQGKPIYVEQFLFMDNTPKFSYNAQIKETEIGQYLENVAEVLDKYTRGYGIWTYRDYRNNMLYNSQFALGEKGWNTEGDPVICKSKEFNTWTCKMEQGNVLSQDIPSVRDHFPNEEYKFEFNVKNVENAIVEIWIGTEKQELHITDKGVNEVTFLLNDSFDFKFRVKKGNIEIDDLCLYSFVQEGHLYNIDNERMEYIQSIVTLNKSLESMDNK